MKPSAREIAEGILYTDQYQLTMAQLYFRQGLHERPARFDHFYRRNPDYGSHQAGYCINAGAGWLLDWMERVAFRERDLSLMRAQTDRVGKRLFHDDFLHWLQEHGSFRSLRLSAIAEGRVVHPNVPLTVVEGPLAMVQIIETPLLNHLNYQTLIATKASRIQQAGRSQLLLEFGMRRGQDKGVNAGARAALIGGADFSSNAGISHVLGFEPKGTHAHSMVQLFMALGGTELDAFQAYADLYPDDCLLLVDTIDTLASGIPNAIRVFERLRARGHEPVGIRLDSGDLAYLAVQASRMLHDAGFGDAKIVLSNSLDEMTILQILSQIQDEAPQYGLEADEVIKRLIYGVGTRLITSGDNAALDGVYKLVAVRDNGKWQPAIKISENPVKTPNPGHKQAWRLYDRRGLATADLLALSDERIQEQEEICLRHPTDAHRFRTLEKGEITRVEPLLEVVYEEGARKREPEEIETMRVRRDADLERLDIGIKRIINPHIYHVSLSQKLWDLKQDLIRAARGSID